MQNDFVAVLVESTTYVPRIDRRRPMSSQHGIHMIVTEVVRVPPERAMDPFPTILDRNGELYYLVGVARETDGRIVHAYERYL